MTTVNSDEVRQKLWWTEPKNTISDHGRFRQRTIGNVFLVLESQCDKAVPNRGNQRLISKIFFKTYYLENKLENNVYFYT